MESSAGQSLIATVLKVGYLVGMIWLYTARPTVLVVAVAAAITTGFFARAVATRRI
jgi:hypothetical protein